ncbi:MAG: AIR carboxylase family protein [Candidatus Aenigmarchaeota archaeon]|nr:AIR carboxylase family protein [Candidatus Aenigmarchaeota archaeon]
MGRRVVIIQGSESDNEYVGEIKDALASYGIGVRIENRLASAHRSPRHMQNLLDRYDNNSETVFVSVAGLSDALSGTVAARFPGRVVAAPPDAKEYGTMKEFSSTSLPKAVDGNDRPAWYATNPHDAAEIALNLFGAYDFSREHLGYIRGKVEEKDREIMMADARVQGAEIILPHTLFSHGKTREVYDVGDGTLLIAASDRVSAFDKVMHERIPGKGEALTELSEYWFKILEKTFPNHFIDRVDTRTIRVKKAERVGIEWVVRKHNYGSVWRDYQKGERVPAGVHLPQYGITLPDGMQLAQELPEPILTATTKAEEGHDMPITKEKAVESGLVTGSAEWDMLADATFKLFAFEREHARKRGIITPDKKNEYGRINGGHILIDEPMTHDSARFWHERSFRIGMRQEGHALDKEFLRQYLLDMGYRGDGDPPHLPDIVVDQISRRCRGAADILTGKETDIKKYGLLTVEQVLAETGGK